MSMMVLPMTIYQLPIHPQQRSNEIATVTKNHGKKVMIDGLYVITVINSDSTIFSVCIKRLELSDNDIIKLVIFTIDSMIYMPH